MRIIGLTGGTGSGKGVVSEILSEKGAFIIDTDAIAHTIILKGKPAYYELLEYFGNGIMNWGGEIDRRELGNIVFRERGEKLNFLNECTHKHIYNEIERQIETAKKSGKSAAVIDAPLLLEGNFRNLCGEIWVVYADEELRLQRIMKRDSIDAEQGRNRIGSQKPWDFYKKHADVIIYNDGNIDFVKKQIDVYFPI
ncbi:MAG: dephospho-CoA kinase [Firmicutes bacterium]|nr:dephospho-CoA kinase [Bacillota bacterium]